MKFDVKTSALHHVQGNAEKNFTLPQVNKVSSASKTLWFVDSFSYDPANDNTYSYRIETVDTRRLPDTTGSHTVRLDEEYSNSYRVETSTGNKNSNLSFRLKAFELPHFVQAKRDYIVLKGRRQSANLIQEVEPGYKAITIIEVLEYDSNKKPRYMYATRAYAVGNTIIVNAFTDAGNSGSKLVLRVTCLYWHQSFNVLFDYRRLKVSKEGLSIQTLAESDNRFVTVPTMYITDERKYDYSIFADEDFFFNGLSAEGRTKAKRFKIINFFGGVGEFVAGGIKLAAGDYAKGVKNIAVGLQEVIKSFKLRDEDHRDPDAAYFVEEKAIPPFSNKRFTLKTDDATKDSLVEVTIWALKFPDEDSPLIQNSLASRSTATPQASVPKHTYARWKHAAIEFSDYLFPEQPQRTDSKDSAFGEDKKS